MILAAGIQKPLTRVAMNIMVHVLGMTSPEWISNGMMLYLEQALAGTHFSWGAMVLLEIVHHIKLVALMANWMFFYGSLLCFFFLEGA